MARATPSPAARKPIPGGLLSRAFLALIALLVFAPDAALACRCPAHLSFSQAYERAQSVVVGKVSALQTNTDGNGSTATVTVSQSWKAQAAPTISVSTSTTCAFNFVQGEEFLLYLFRTPEGGYYTSKCVGDLPLAKAEPALSWLKGHGKALPVSVPTASSDSQH
jgi:hypothetical protein